MNTMDGYGHCASAVRRFSSSSQLSTILEGHAGLDASLPGGRRTAKLPPSIERLVRLYDAWGKPEHAAEWWAKLPVEQETVATDQAFGGESPTGTGAAAAAVSRPPPLRGSSA